MNYAASWLGALHESSAAAAMRESIWLFPLVETIHILGGFNDQVQKAQHDAA